MMTLSKPIVYDAYIEKNIDNLYTAQLLDLLGCYARGSSEAEALQRLDDAIPAYFDWLRSHDDYMPIVKGPFQVRRAELLSANVDGLPWDGVFFDNDALPMEDDDLDWALAILGWAYDDLLSLIRRLPRERFSQPLKTEQHRESTPNMALRYALGLQMTCLTYITEPPGAPAQPPEFLADDLVALALWTREQALERLRTTTDAERTLIQKIDGVGWSLRKVARTSIMIARVTAEVIANGV